MALDGRGSMTEDQFVKPESIPALYEHAVNVYNEMVKEANPDDQILVYKGHLTQLFKKLRLSVPYYTIIKNRLVAMGCIEQAKRGGGTAVSEWVLWKEPTLTEWQQSASELPRSRGDRYSVMDQRQRDHAKMVRNLQVQVEELYKEIATLRALMEKRNV